MCDARRVSVICFAVRAGKGLKFGIYSSSGPLTCANYTGSWGHEAQDAATFASWGADFFKLDCCCALQAASAVALPHFLLLFVLQTRTPSRTAPSPLTR